MALTLFLKLRPTYVQIWDAVGGILKGVFKGITEADITAVCLDDRYGGAIKDSSISDAYDRMSLPSTPARMH